MDIFFTVEIMMELKFKKFSPDAIAPERKSEFAAGSDLCVNESKTRPSNDRYDDDVRYLRLRTPPRQAYCRCKCT